VSMRIRERALIGRRDEDIWRNPELRSSPTNIRKVRGIRTDDFGLKHAFRLNSFVRLAIAYISRIE